MRFMRGGSWEDPDVDCRSAFRCFRFQKSPSLVRGFRIAVELQ